MTTATCKRPATKKTKALVLVPFKTPLKTSGCMGCGAPVAHRWVDHETGNIFESCDNQRCQAFVWNSIPRDAKERLEQRIWAKLGVVYASEIEITRDSKTKPTIKGRPASKCWAVWNDLDGDTADALKIYELYKFKPKERYMVFTDKGRFVALVKTKAHAESLAKDTQVVVFWGGF